MIMCSSSSFNLHYIFSVCHILLIVILLPHNVNSSMLFNFTSFPQNMNSIFYQGDAFSANGAIQVTRNQQKIALTNSVGRASYFTPVQIWDGKTGKIADFMTHFTFIIDALNSTHYGDGLSFFLAPFEAEIPENSFAGYLGLFNKTDTNSVEDQIVAVEFDSHWDTWDPSDDHVGINVNSIVSLATVEWKSSIKNGSVGNAWITYNSSTKNLSVYLTYAEHPVYGGGSSLSQVVDLSKVLPERVRVGFSAATGDWIETHKVLSWSFSSNLEIDEEVNRTFLVVGLCVGFGLLSLAFGAFWYVWWRKKVIRRITKNDHRDYSMDDDFEKGTGPKRFTFRELSQATNNFSEEGKLGEGGFGGVYKGVLSSSNIEVAVKRISSGSKQGKKEYASEVRIISQLRHRNLVQLIGWCHEQRDFVLVYEYMPNGSLDSHLFGGLTKLMWMVRYKIALGLASALLYLHEEWEQCVVHRDVKSSNVMLDASYNAKLGDFGLARLVDHELGSQTTVLAGTLGYLAPECVTIGKASKESDVYSFGVVALEIACGRKPVEPKAEPSRIRLVEWVWELYGNGKVLEAADEALGTKFDEREMERLMVVGLWCCHPDHTLRPTIRQVINVLNFEAPLPRLPSKLPVPMYFAPPMEMCRFSYTSSVGVTDSESDQNRTQTTISSSDSSSMSAGSSKALLQVHKGCV